MEPSWKYIIRAIVTAATVLAVGFLVAASIWDGLSPLTPLGVKLVLWAAFVASNGILFVNIVLAAFVKGERLKYATLALVVLVAYAFSSWTCDWHAKARRNWFFREEQGAYDQMANRILNDPTLLADKHRDLGPVVGHPDGVFAQTNDDGSVTILFRGRDGSARAGYLFQSPGTPTAYLSNANLHIQHLTNGWYEY